MKRRTLILSALGATSALIVGWGELPARSRLGGKELMLPKVGDVSLNGWIKIAADELDVPLSAMRLEQAGSDTIYGNVAMLVAVSTKRQKLKWASGWWASWRVRWV